MKLLRLAPENTKFGFMRFRRVSYPLSALLSIISVLMFLFVGMNFGIDFAGGTQVDMRAKTGEANVADIRTKAEGLGVGPVEVQRIGAESDVLLRLGVQPGGDAGQQTAITKIKDAFGADYEFRSVNSVGPTVSAELVQRGTLGVVVAILAVLTYLWFRFEWQFAVGAIIGTMHDLLLTVGFFCVTQLEFNQTSIAAILTIVGLLAQRDGGGARPHPRGDAQIQAPFDVRNHRLVDQRGVAAHHHDGDDGLSRAARALLPRRPRHPLVLGGDDLGHFRRHLFFDLHLLADAHLHGRARRHFRQDARKGNCRRGREG